MQHNIIKIIQEIHSKNEQNPTIQPATNVYILSILEKYTEMQNIMLAINIGSGIILSLSWFKLLALMSFLQLPLPLGIGASSGHCWKQVDFIHIYI